MNPWKFGPLNHGPNEEFASGTSGGQQSVGMTVAWGGTICRNQSNSTFRFSWFSWRLQQLNEALLEPWHVRLKDFCSLLHSTTQDFQMQTVYHFWYNYLPILFSTNYFSLHSFHNWHGEFQKSEAIPVETPMLTHIHFRLLACSMLQDFEMHLQKMKKLKPPR